MACREAKILLKRVSMIELRGGFGTIGHAKVTEAVDGKFKFAVRFDNHPGYDNLSGGDKWLN